MLLENEVIEAVELDENTKDEIVKAVEKSFKGEPITDHQAVLLFYWARHQNERAFSFVPKQYRLNAEPKTVKKRKVPSGK